jgi:hypothetical protein
MTESRAVAESPNKDIDKAIKSLMKGIEEKPPDIAVKIINSAIAWEKVKANIKDTEDSFDPDNI